MAARRPGSGSQQGSEDSRPASAQPQGNGAAAGGSRPTSARPLSATTAGAKRRSSTGLQQVGVSSQAVASQLQKLLEEGEDEEVPVEGMPSQLSITSELQAGRKAGDAQQQPRQGEEYDSFDVDGLAGEPPPLEMEDSQELKRRIFPPEVIRQLDHSNAARLEEIRGQWASLLKCVRGARVGRCLMSRGPGRLPGSW